MSKHALQVSVAVGVAIVVVGFFFIFNSPFMMLDSFNNAANPLGPEQVGAGGLVMQDLTPGQGAEAKAGDTVQVHYTGRLQDGTVFDTSVGRSPFQFVLGSGSVIKGWDQGLQGMKVGGKRLLVIPPDLAYGAVDYGPIPANSTLVFEVELLNVVNPAGQ